LLETVYAYRLNARPDLGVGALFEAFWPANVSRAQMWVRSIQRWRWIGVWAMEPRPDGNRYLVGNFAFMGARHRIALTNGHDDVNQGAMDVQSPRWAFDSCLSPCFWPRCLRIRLD